MTLRTPRRRISPRTKRRYRAIREFFRRAIGSSSQPDIKISSSIALNVTDLKRKIIGIEEQLDHVSKHCHDVACFQNSPVNQSESLLQSDIQHDTGPIKEETEVSSDGRMSAIETRVLYKTSENHYRKSDESDNEQKQCHESLNVIRPDKMNNEYERFPKAKKKEISKLDKINECDSKLHKLKTHSAFENFSAAYSTSSLHSLANPRNAHSYADYTGRRNDRRRNKLQHRSVSPNQLKDRKRKGHTRKQDEYVIYEEKPIPMSSRRHKQKKRQLDQDFIADIIKRQYKPVKMFGKRDSDLSQFSAPVCRDQEYSLHENMQADSELCSCCYENKRTRHKHNDLNDMRSICDTRLYSSKRNSRLKHRRVVDIYNDSELYDLVPVKEKTSPKSRRKFFEDNMIPCSYYKEVPPSPRTLRPRLNLKTQYYTNFDDDSANVHHNRWCSPGPARRHQDYEENCIGSDITSEVTQDRSLRRVRKTYKPAKVQVGHKQEIHDTSTISSLQYPPYRNEQADHRIEMSLNKTQETEVSADKTDKALSEIKDILQRFLQDMKKENASQCDKSDSTSKTADNSSVLPNSGHNFTNYSLGNCAMPPYLPPPTYGSPCCYPLVYPMNYMQNGYTMPSPSVTCTNCANVPKEPVPSDHQCNKNKNTETFNTETEELIKEIYKFVAQGPPKRSDCDSNRNRKKVQDTKVLTSRSVGDSYRASASKHDAKVGTPRLKYSSKSCEAIGSKMNSESYYSTNPSYSDTILEKLSLEATHSDSDVSNEESIENKIKENKFSKVLRTFGLLKKKKDTIEELDESESVIEEDIKPKRAPFRQETTNYMMYGQDYYKPPPVPPRHYPQPPEYHPDYHPPYNPRASDYPQQPIHDLYSNKMYQQQQLRDQERVSAYRSQPRPSAPPYNRSYDNRYNQQQPQVPLCLKEIEVRSTGTQSERKMSIFRKFTKKMQTPEQRGKFEDPAKNMSTQTAKDNLLNKPNYQVNKPKWLKNLQEKAMQDKINPMTFSLKTQKQLAEGDMKMRNAMLKKLFYKRNPFSPNNLIVKTLLGRDKSSFGEPPMVFKPQMFF